MERTDLLALYDKEMRREVQYPDLRREESDNVVRLVGTPEPNGGNFVIYSRLTMANADQVIDEQIAYFDAIGHPFEWKVYDHDTPPDLRDRLLARGFTQRDSADAIMAIDLHDLPDGLQPSPDIAVRKLQRREELQDVIAVLESVWPGDDTNWLERVIGNDMVERPDFTSVYVATVAGVPACCGWVLFHADTHFASLWGGSTVATYRQQGLYRAVLATRLQAARRRGFRWATIDASPMNKPIAAHYGFQLLTMAQACFWRFPE